MKLKLALPLLDVLLNNVENSDSWGDWLINLNTDLASEYSKSASDEQYSAFARNGETDRGILIETLRERAVEVGFSDEIYSIIAPHGILLPEEFASILRQGKLIKDEPLKNDDHGELVHMFQIDYMIYLAKKNNLDPRLVFEFYQYMGMMKPIGKGETSIKLWDIFFDRLDGSIFMPEKWNGWIQIYFNLSN